MEYQLQEITGTDPEVVVQVIDSTDEQGMVPSLVALGERLQQQAFEDGKTMSELRYAVRIPLEE